MITPWWLSWIVSSSSKKRWKKATLVSASLIGQVDVFFAFFAPDFASVKTKLTESVFIF